MSRQANVANDNKYHTLKGFIDDEGYPWSAPRNFWREQIPSYPFPSLPLRPLMFSLPFPSLFSSAPCHYWLPASLMVWGSSVGSTSVVRAGARVANANLGMFWAREMYLVGTSLVLFGASQNAVIESDLLLHFPGGVATLRPCTCLWVLDHSVQWSVISRRI